MGFNEALGASFREVGTGTRNGTPTRIVRASRQYPTSPQDLWEAITDKDRLQRWFSEVSGDFKLGGRFSVQGNADGDIIQCEPPHDLALTWEFGGTISWLRITVEEAENGSVLTLEHEMPSDKTSEAHWDQFGPGATGVGWDMAILGLDVHLSGDGQPALKAGAAWAEGPQGKVTLRKWANAWGEAHIKSGAPAQSAKSMADRTGDFYTGEG